MNVVLMKCFPLNARVLNYYNKRNTLYNWLQDIDIDIVMLQETHFIELKEHIYNARWRGHTFHCFSSSPSSRGVSIFIKKKFPFELINYHRSSDGQKILLNLKITFIRCKI